MNDDPWQEVSLLDGLADLVLTAVRELGRLQH